MTRVNTTTELRNPAGRAVPHGRPFVVCLTLCAAVMAYATALAVAPSPAVDLFWQLHTGKYIAAAHAVPYYNDDSWSRPHQPWIVHEWGMCLLLWECFHHDGFAGIWIMEAVFLAAIFATLFAVLMRETGGAPITCVCLSVWAAKVASPLISPRPHLVTWLCVTLLVGLVLQVRRNPKRTGRLWLLPLLCAVWANFHGGVIIGVGLLAAFGVCDLVQASAAYRRMTDGIQKEPADAATQRARLGRREIAVAACCALALIANPYGWRLYQIFGMTVGDRTMPSFVTEWAALDFHSLLGITVEALTAFIAAGLALSREKRDLADVVVVAILLHSALTASRNVPIFALAGLPVAARHLQSALTRMLSGATIGDGQPSLFGSNPPTVPAAVIAIAIVLQSLSFAAGQLGRSGVRLPAGAGQVASVAFDLDQFPSAACRFIRAERFPTADRMYNDYNLGGYILYTLPEYRIFISTQTDVFFGRVLSDYARIDDEPFDWESMLGRYRPDFVLISTGEAQSRLFAASPNWALCYADRPDLDAGSSLNMLIFVPNTIQNAALIARCRKDCPALRADPSLLAKNTE